jgi:hypothetical protein
MIYKRFLSERPIRYAWAQRIIRCDIPFIRSRRAIVLPMLWLPIWLLLTAYIPASMPQSVIAQRLHPHLRTVVLAQPEANLSIIVQKTTPDARIEEVVATLGGAVTKDLPILQAFAADLSGRAVLQLSANPHVRWISLDSPVASAGKPTPTLSIPTTNTYLDTLNVRPLWNQGLRGDGIGVAVIDSGISPDRDFTNLLQTKSFQRQFSMSTDMAPMWPVSLPAMALIRPASTWALHPK